MLLSNPQAVYTGGREWETLWPWLDRVPLAELSNLTGIPVRTLRSYPLGQRVPAAVWAGGDCKGVGEDGELAARSVPPS